MDFLRRTLVILKLLKNSMVQINKTASNIRFNEVETDRELIFQQLYCSLIITQREKILKPFVQALIVAAFFSLEL